MRAREGGREGGKGEKKKSETEPGRGGGVRDVGDGRRKGNLCSALKADAGRSLINVRVELPPTQASNNT